MLLKSIVLECFFNIRNALWHFFSNLWDSDINIWQWG